MKNCEVEQLLDLPKERKMRGKCSGPSGHELPPILHLQSSAKVILLDPTHCHRLRCRDMQYRPTLTLYTSLRLMQHDALLFCWHKALARGRVATLDILLVPEHIIHCILTPPPPFLPLPSKTSRRSACAAP